MANEGYFSISLKAAKNGAKVDYTLADRFDVAGTQMQQITQNIGTTAELISFGEISGAPQLALIVNLDATNYVEIGGDSGLTVFKIKIPAGKFAFITPSSATMYAKANTAACNILPIAIEV